MKQESRQKLIDALASGNRPIRIFVFGGIILAYLVMLLLGKLLDINVNIDDEFDWPGIFLMVVSLLIGFGVSFSVVQYVDTHKSETADD